MSGKAIYCGQNCMRNAIVAECMQHTYSPNQHDSRYRYCSRSHQQQSLALSLSSPSGEWAPSTSTRRRFSPSLSLSIYLSPRCLLNQRRWPCTCLSYFWQILTEITPFAISIQTFNHTVERVNTILFLFTCMGWKIWNVALLPEYHQYKIRPALL